jgi:hypothetical protein
MKDKRIPIKQGNNYLGCYELPADVSVVKDGVTYTSSNEWLVVKSSLHGDVFLEVKSELFDGAEAVVSQL